VIKQDNSFLQAWYEKSFSLFKWGNTRIAPIGAKPPSGNSATANQIKNVYVNYGSALDALDKPDEASKYTARG